MQPPGSIAGSATRRASRAFSASPAPASTCCVVGRVHAHAQVARRQHDRVDGFLRDLGDDLGARVQLVAHDLARQLHGGARDGQRHLLFQAVPLVVEVGQQRAELGGHLAGEGFLEGLERDLAVAIAVLVAGLARVLHLVQPLGLGRRRRRRRRRGVHLVLGAVGRMRRRRAGAAERAGTPGGEAVELLARDEARLRRAARRQRRRLVEVARSRASGTSRL